MPLSQVSYASLKQLQDNASGTQSTTAADTVRLTQFGIRASKIIDQITGVVFAPVIATRYIRASDDAVSGFKITLPEPMLELTTVTLADSGSTVLTAGTDIRGYPRNNDPIFYLQALADSTYLNSASNSLDDDITILGVWGWHSDYSNAWVTSGDAVKTSALLTTGTTVLVDDADGVSGDGYLPRFSPGNLIKVDSEYMAITGVDTSTDTLTVVRGQNGSTAAAHEIAAAISVWAPEPDIVRACMLIGTFGYDRKGQSSRVSWESVRAGSNRYDIPSEALEILRQYDVIKVGVV